MSAALFTADFQPRPYWWDRAPPPADDAQSLPARADVVIIGGGYTGLHAALVTARGGRSTVVLDAAAPGSGCSTRNGGQVSTGIKPRFEALVTRYGKTTARAIVASGQCALAWLGEFIAAEGIDCDFHVCGRFHAAHSAAAFQRLVAELRAQPAGLETGAQIVTRDAQRAELASDRYHGGVVYPQHAALDPARYYQALHARTCAAGARVIGHCAAERIDGATGAWRVATRRGTIAAREIIIATNGYTGALTPWLQRRVIPIGSYIIATEPLPPQLIAELMPTNRVISDTRRVVYYYRASPDRRRILFGGRVSTAETDPRRTAPRLRQELLRLFPQLAGVRISHSWAGFVAYTFDTLAHEGQHAGMRYALGYCGSGVAMAGYLGTRAGTRVVGTGPVSDSLAELTFPTRPLYRGKPWFLGPVVAAYRWLDRLGR